MVRTYDPTGYRINSRSAEQISEAQAAQHQQAVAENQNAIQYTDNGDGTRTASGGVQTRQAAPVGLTPEQQAAQNNAALYTPSAAQQSQTSGGVIEASRNARLDANNATPEQRAQNQANLQGIMNATSRLQQLQNGGDALPAGVEDPMLRAQIKAANAQEAVSLQEQISQAQDKEKKKGDESAASDAASQQMQNPQQAGASAFFQNLPPEAAALAPYFENILSEISAGQDANAEATNAMLNGGTIDVNGQQVNVKGINSVYDEMDKKIADMEAGYNSIQEGIQGMLDKVKEQQEKTISEQEEAAKERLAWQETQMLRQVAKEKQAAVDARIARLALTGGFGSDGGLREIEETRAAYENRIDDIKTEFGVQRTDLAAKFTGLYMEASNKHLTDSIQNIKDTAAALERIAGQSLSNKQARNTAEQNVLGKFLETQTAGRKEYAASLKDFALQMQDAINQERTFKKLDQDQAWEEFKWLKNTYGVNLPESAIAGLSKRLPGYDLKTLAQQQTADEVAKSRSGGGIGGFASYQLNGLGQPPSFENFLKQKETDALASGAVKFDTSAKAMADYKKEYAARYSAQTQTDPSSIISRFEQRAAAQNLSGPVYKRTAALVNQYIQNGQYQQAADIVDNIGDDVPSTEATSFQQALNARYDILKLHDAMQQIGQFGPVTGRLKDLDPYNADVVRVQNLITQTVPNLARGVFREVGVLTDQDVARYTKTLENPQLTLQQAQNAYNDLIDKVNVSMQNQLDVWDAGNKRTKGFKQIYKATPVMTQNPAASADEDYANSILLGK